MRYKYLVSEPDGTPQGLLRFDTVRASAYYLDRATGEWVFEQGWGGAFLGDRDPSDKFRDVEEDEALRIQSQLLGEDEEELETSD